jgi:anti-anti-sigma regulatory factor
MPEGSAMTMAGTTSHMVELPSEAGLRAAQDIATLLQEAIVANSAITVATSAVKTADLTTIQLLLAAKKRADSLGKSLSLAALPQGALRTLLIELGFLDSSGAPLTADGGFWTPSTTAKGRAQ